MIHPEIIVRVTDIAVVAESIKQFTFERVDGGSMPVFAPGAHIVVSMDDQGKLRRNPYSLMSSPSDTTSYQISVLRVVESRGGSAFMHEHVDVGDTMTISHPIDLFPLHATAKRHVLIAGGIGITPFLPMMEVLNESGQVFELHYSMRSRRRGAFLSELERRYGSRVSAEVDDEGGRLDTRKLLIDQPLGTHIYVCAPLAMIDLVFGVARELGWAEENLHREVFLAPPAGSPFYTNLAKSGTTVYVAEHQSLLESIEAAGIDVPYLCRGGACGQCETTVIDFDGQLMHHDIFLTDDEKVSGTKIMPCVSRFVGASLTVEL